jgi:hypothetical protein
MIWTIHRLILGVLCDSMPLRLSSLQLQRSWVKHHERCGNMESSDTFMIVSNENYSLPHPYKRIRQCQVGAITLIKASAYEKLVT